MKLFLTILMLMLLAGCGQVERATAKWTGYSIMCVDNVSYIQFTSGASVQYNTDGSVKTCVPK
jgi:uncharacterized protein YceK